MLIKEQINKEASRLPTNYFYKWAQWMQIASLQPVPMDAPAENNEQHMDWSLSFIVPPFCRMETLVLTYGR